MSETLPGFPVPRDWDKEFEDKGIDRQAERRMIQAWLKVIGRHKYTKSVNENAHFLDWCNNQSRREFAALLWEVPDWRQSPGYSMVRQSIDKRRRIYVKDMH
jgi:hypothetical protein